MPRAAAPPKYYTLLLLLPSHLLRVWEGHARDCHLHRLCLLSQRLQRLALNQRQQVAL
jgi:hypothetical protein